MTEIEFLVKLLSEDSMSDEMKLKLLARIGEIESNRMIVQHPPITLPYISTPHVTIPYPQPCIHDYPHPWFGTVPPSCRKCGQPPVYPYYTITCQTNNSANPADFIATTGLVGSIPSTSLKNN